MFPRPIMLILVPILLCAVGVSTGLLPPEPYMKVYGIGLVVFGVLGLGSTLCRLTR